MTRTLTRCLLLAAVLALAAASPAPAASPLAGTRPNIVVVLVDDQPALDGRLVIREPNVDAIFHQHGVYFSDFHGETPLCCPGRAGYLTGQHTENHGVVKNDAHLFRPRMTIATQLQRAGYTTALVGKYFNLWGRCCAPKVPPGWTHFVAFDEPFGDGGAYYDYSLSIDGGRTPEEHGSAPADYSTDVLTGKALHILRASPADRPVFLWVAPFAPHQKLEIAPRHAGDAACETMPSWKPPSFNEADVSDKPAFVQHTPPLGGTVGRDGVPLVNTCKALLAVDDMVGALRDELAAEGRLDHTLFVYAGDNGVSAGEHRLRQKQSPYTTEVPFMLSWPAGLGTAPRIVGERVMNIDLAPTLCAVAGCTLGPYPNGQATPDGISFLPLLDGTATSLGRDAVLEDERASNSGGSPSVPPTWFGVVTTSSSPLAFQGCALAATGGCRWHYLEYKGGERELYDDSNGPCYAWSPGRPGDPCELQNRAGDPALAGVQRALAARLAELERERGS